MQHGIKANSFEELIKQMNEFEKSNNVFASQVHPIITDRLTWYGIIFYKDIDNRTKKVAPTPTTSDSGTPDKKIDKKPKEPSKPQLKFIEKNKTELLEQGYNIDNVKTSKQAWRIISEFKKQNNLGSSEI